MPVRTRRVQKQRLQERACQAKLTDSDVEERLANAVEVAKVAEAAAPWLQCLLRRDVLLEQLGQQLLAPGM